MEEQTPFGKPDYELPSYLENVQSQLPALQLLMQLGWQYLTPEETVQLRGGRVGSTTLEPIPVLKTSRRNFRPLPGKMLYCCVTPRCVGAIAGNS